jgi:hypothetical protein
MTVKPTSDLKGLLICMQFIGVSEQGVAVLISKALQKQMNFSPIPLPFNLFSYYLIIWSIME